MERSSNYLIGNPLRCKQVPKCQRQGLAPPHQLEPPAPVMAAMNNPHRCSKHPKQTKRPGEKVDIAHSASSRSLNESNFSLKRVSQSSKTFESTKACANEALRLKPIFRIASTTSSHKPSSPMALLHSQAITSKAKTSQTIYQLSAAIATSSFLKHRVLYANKC